MLTRVAAVFVLIALSSAVASGQDKTDVVTLADGDRVTGEIIDLVHARLEIKTDDAGTIDIEWDARNDVGVTATLGWSFGR